MIKPVHAYKSLAISPCQASECCMGMSGTGTLVSPFNAAAALAAPILSTLPSQSGIYPPCGPVLVPVLKERKSSVLTIYWFESTCPSNKNWWTGLAPWEFEFAFPGSRIYTFQVWCRPSPLRLVLPCLVFRCCIAPRVLHESQYTVIRLMT